MSTIVDGGLYRESTFMLQGLFSPELIANRSRFVLTVGAIMVGVACLSMAMGVLAARCSAIATQGFARNMRSTLLGKIESFSFSNIDHISTPQLITRATTDINTLRDTMRQSLVTLYRAPVMVILATVMSFIVSPGLAPLLLICIPLLVVLMVILLKVGQPRFKRMLKMMDGMNQAVRENLVASRVVKAFVRGGYESKRFDKTTDDLRQAQLGAGRLFTLSGPITMGIMWTCSVLILFFGGREIIFRTTGLLTGQLVSLVNYAGMAVNSLSMISWLVMSLSRAQASLVRINEVLDEEIDITDGPSDAAVESGSIDFEDVCFSYTRDPDKLALRHVTLHIASGETIGVIGGTGSFGGAVLDRFLDTDVKEIRIFSRDEKKQDDMRHEYQVKYPDVANKIKFFIGDVRNLQSCRNAMPGVDYIFHAAALKQVPSCEFFPMEAVKTNVIGTDNVLTAAIEAGVGAVICLSTDKAAYPINAMGITKAVEEKIAVAKSRYSGKTKICCTRYGNVMCSRGSVIPLWIDQIRNGNPITLTEPTMTRFIMSLEEAVDLVLFAFEHGQNGDILVQKAPACTIQTQAEAVCELFGGKKDDIKVIGIRHGEKMYETLLTNEECAKAEDMGNFYRVPADNRGLNYDKYFKEGETERNTLTEFNSNNTRILNVEETKAKIAALDYIKKELSGEGNFVQ